MKLDDRNYERPVVKLGACPSAKLNGMPLMRPRFVRRIARIGPPNATAVGF